MKIKVNGAIRDLKSIQQPTNLKEVIKELGHNSQLIVVEFNGTIITPDHWGNQEIKDHDTLEIVTIVGGGS